MRQPLEEKHIEDSSEDAASCNFISSADLAQSSLLKLELQYERCLNQLESQLHGCITSFLGQNQCQGDRQLATESAIFQTLINQLSSAPDTNLLAIALPTARSQSELYQTWTIAYLVYGQEKSIYPTSFVLPGAQKPLVLQSGKTLTGQDLQGLCEANPERVWPIVDDQQWVRGWLLIGSRFAVSGSTELVAAASQLRSQFIQRGIDCCVAALRQVSLIQRNQQQQRELAQQNQDLAQANKLKSEFLANTSHEIRTPLSSILGFTHLLRVQGYSSTNLRHQEYLNIILTSGQHLLALINDILDLSKIEANQLDLQWEPIEVHSVCQTALTLVKEKASDKGLLLHLEIAPEAKTLTADVLRLKQMLFNLLSNAIKFTLRGTVGVQVNFAGAWLRFTVWDTGIGISKEQQDLLFRPYSQLINPAAGRDEGTGLGLALTQKLAELHGGWIEMHSEIGQGSRFTIVLPLEPPTATDEEQERVTQSPPNCLEATAPSPSKSLAQDPLQVSQVPASPAEVPSSRPNSLLLVEDNLFNAKLMLTYLSKLGYEVTWAKSGHEMWQALERSTPSVVLMDIQLPGEDGLSLIRQLKADSRFLTIPVIAQTAMAMTGDRNLCLEAGADDYISKPIDLDGLAQMLTRHIPAN